MNWIECDSCGEEFKVVTDSFERVEFCPFCGSQLEIEEEDEE